MKVGSVVVHWESYEKCLTELLELADNGQPCNIIFPLIGCGLAGGSVVDLIGSTRNVLCDFEPISDMTSDDITITFVSNNQTDVERVAYVINMM